MATGKPGMGWESGRCGTCDGRYCGAVCYAHEGAVWVVGMGWKGPAAAQHLEQKGATVHWDEVWTDADGGHIIHPDTPNW